jgi:hypothetical protein
MALAAGQVCMPTGEKTRPLGVRIGLHPVFRPLHDLAGRRDVVHEAHRLGGGRPDLVALEQHLQGVAGLHQAADALRAAAAGEQPDLDLGQADARLVEVGDDPVVAGERQFEGAAEAHAVDRGGDRLANRLQPAIEARHCADLRDELAYRRLLALGLDEAPIVAPRRLQHRQVRAGGEALLAGGEHHALHRRVRGDLVDDYAELLNDVGRDDVHRAARHVPGDERDAVGVGFKTEIGQIHGSDSVLAQTRSMIVAVPMPPPMHSVISAVPLPVRSSSSSAVPRIIAPVAPSG